MVVRDMVYKRIFNLLQEERKKESEGDRYFVIVAGEYWAWSYLKPLGIDIFEEDINTSEPVGYIDDAPFYFVRKLKRDRLFIMTEAEFEKYEASGFSDRFLMEHQRK